MIHVSGRKEQDSKGCYHATQNGVKSKTYELFISKVFYLIFPDPGLLQVHETAENKTVVNKDY